MKLIKDALKIFCRSKILTGISILTLFFSGKYALKYYGSIGFSMAAEQLQHVLKLSLYLFVIAMFISYEYFKKLRPAGIAETVQATPEGKKGRQFLAAFLTLTMYVLVVTIFLTVCAVYAYSFYGIKDSHGEYIRHIILNMLLNIFLIMELGNLTGAFLSGFRGRITAYLAMVLAAWLVSPCPEHMADQVCRSTNGKTPVYHLVELFNILPLVNTKFTPNFSFGESLLPYRVALILFWCAVMGTGILFSSSRTRKWSLLGGLACCLCFLVYSLPSSKVSMNDNPANTLAHDQYYYIAQDGEIRNETADYRISGYRMEFSIGLQMKADVVMDVDRTMPEYKMSLYHGYKVKSAWNQDKNPLPVTQEGDYVTVTNDTGKEITQVRLVYEGSSPAYYSNVQGIFLPGYFAYYPRAGHIPLYDVERYAVSGCFVDRDTDFEVKVNTHQKLYTNLEKDGDWYRGKCDGFTMFAGFYRVQELSNGNRLVYPYIYCLNADETDGTLEESLKEYYKSIEESLDSQGRKNTTVFCGPNVNQTVNRYDGANQIITKSIVI